MTEAAPFLTGRTMIMAGHEFQKFVGYPISAEADRGRGRLVNWIAERKAVARRIMPGGGGLEPGGGSSTSSCPGFRMLAIRLARCAGADPGRFADLRISAGRSGSTAERWTFGRVTLLGDAAHPMYPIGSNGASQAILDARVLAREILDKGQTQGALLAYEEERRPATTRLVLLNRQNGPEQVMHLVEERAPDGLPANVTDVLANRSWKTSPRITRKSQASRSRRLMPGRRSCRRRRCAPRMRATEPAK